jgi:hypothetical protein
MVSDQALDSMTKAQLIALAKVRGVELPSGGQVTKAEVLAALREAKAKRNGAKS